MEQHRSPPPPPPPAIEFPEDEGTEPQYDESDLPTELRIVNGSKKFQNFTSSIANQLLLVSVLEHLCHMYAKDPTHSRRLFQLLCKTFTQMGLLSSFASCDEFSSLRLQHNRAITQLMKVASQQILDKEVGGADPQTNSGNEVLFEAQTSRYINEFDEISRLGKGAYGTVYKVKNKLDGQFYAIKKILIKKATKSDCMKAVMGRMDTCSSPYQLCAGGRDCCTGENEIPPQYVDALQTASAAAESMLETAVQQGHLNLEEMSNTSSFAGFDRKVLREVKVLAALQHPNIVGYHTAWMEHVQPGCLKAKKTLELPYPKKTSEPGSTKDNSSAEETEESNSIIFADLDNAVSRNEEGSEMSVCERSTNSHDSSCTSEAASRSPCTDNPPSALPCYPRGRNKDSEREEFSQKDQSLQGQCEMEYHLMLHIQMQLCETSLWDWMSNRNKGCLRTEKSTDPYQHVDVNWTLKIFQELLEGVYYIHSMGVLHRDIKPRNIFLHGPEHHVKIGDFGLACKDMIQNETRSSQNAKKAAGLIHTSGVGTCLYASPEQLQGCQYSFESDMYSVGVILLELFQPFGTEMERTEILSRLRNGHIPVSFSGKWPIQTKYVKLLTSEVSSRRPTAGQLLESELFHKAANVICHLQQKVMQQAEQIKLLEEKIEQLLQEREERDRIKYPGSPV